jgi:hypothetical protein
MRIHHTMGVYPNGDRVHNGVAEADLKSHIDYNLLWRPGRAFFVDGQCLNAGYLKPDQIEAITAELLANPVVMKQVSPKYH